MAAKPKKEINWTVIGIALAVIGLIITLLAWVHPFSPTTPPSGVLDTLTTYCNAVKKRDFYTAYYLNSNAERRFANESDYTNFSNTTFNSHGGLLSCNVGDTGDDGSSGHGTVTYTFNDSTILVKHYMLIMEDGGWKLNTTCASACN